MLRHEVGGAWMQRLHLCLGGHRGAQSRLFALLGLLALSSWAVSGLYVS